MSLPRLFSRALASAERAINPIAQRTGCFFRQEAHCAQTVPQNVANEASATWTYAQAFSSAILQGESLTFADRYASYRATLDLMSHGPLYRAIVKTHHSAALKIDQAAVLNLVHREQGVREVFRVLP